MKFWIDAQLSSALAPWLNDTFGVQAFSLEWLGLQKAAVFTKSLFGQSKKSLTPFPKLHTINPNYNVSYAEVSHADNRNSF